MAKKRKNRNSTTKPSMQEIGRSGLSRQGGRVYEEFKNDLQFPQAAQVYQEMSDNDPIIGAIFYMIESKVRNVKWSVTPVDDTDESIAHAEFLESCMHDMGPSWSDTISEIMSFLTYGFSFHEIIYKIRRGPDEESSMYRSKFSDGKIGWKRIPVRAQDTLNDWVFAEDGDIKAFVQANYFSDARNPEVIIPLDKGLLFRTRVRRDNPEGKSLLRNVYRPWYYKKRLEEIEGIGIERDLAGLPMLTPPEYIDLFNSNDPNSVKMLQYSEDLLRNIRRDAEEGVIVPYGWELKLLSSGSNRQFDTNAIINRYDSRIAMSLLSDVVLLGNGSSGSYALAEVKESLLATSIQSHLKNIADVFNNYAVPKLFKANGIHLEELPKITPGEIDSPSLKELSLLLRSLNLDYAKDKSLVNYLFNICGLPEVDNETFEAYSQAQDTDNDDQDDTVDNDFEQSDALYTGQGG